MVTQKRISKGDLEKLDAEKDTEEKEFRAAVVHYRDSKVHVADEALSIKEQTEARIRELFKNKKAPTPNPAFDGAYDGYLVYHPSFEEYHKKGLKDFANYRPLVDPKVPTPGIRGYCFLYFYVFDPRKMDPIPLPISGVRELKALLDQHIGRESPNYWISSAEPDDIDVPISRMLQYLFGSDDFTQGASNRTFCVGYFPPDVHELAQKLLKSNAEEVFTDPSLQRPSLEPMLLTPFDVHPDYKPENFAALVTWVQKFLIKPKDYFYSAAVRARSGQLPSAYAYDQFIEKELRQAIRVAASKPLVEIDEKFNLTKHMSDMIDRRMNTLYNEELAVPLYLPYSVPVDVLAFDLWWFNYKRRAAAGLPPEPWVGTSKEEVLRYRKIAYQSFQDAQTVFLHRPDADPSFWMDGVFNVAEARRTTVYKGRGDLSVDEFDERFYLWEANEAKTKMIGWSSYLKNNPFDALNRQYNGTLPRFVDCYFGRLPMLVMAEYQTRPEMFTTPLKALVHCICKMEWGMRQYLLPKFIHESLWSPPVSEILDTIFRIFQMKNPGDIKAAGAAMRASFGENYRGRYDSEIYEKVIVGIYGPAAQVGAKANGWRRLFDSDTEEDSEILSFNRLNWEVL